MAEEAGKIDGMKPIYQGPGDRPFFMGGKDEKKRQACAEADTFGSH